MKILFLAKHKPFTEDAAELLKLHFSEAEIVFGDSEQPFPSCTLTKQFDYVMSYVSPWIVPQQVLDNTKIAAINFHPGPPEYPGIGCTNFAVYNGEKEFGITAHHMEASVDSGNIIAVERFPVFNNDSVYSLTQRCYAYIYISFIKIFSLILTGQSLPQSKEHWRRKPFTRKQLNELCIITKDMSKNEISRRIKATKYPGMPGAFIELAETKFCVDSLSNKNKKGRNI